jgi:hypothetical protein
MLNVALWPAGPLHSATNPIPAVRDHTERIPGGVTCESKTGLFPTARQLLLENIQIANEEQTKLHSASGRLMLGGHLSLRPRTGQKEELMPTNEESCSYESYSCANTAKRHGNYNVCIAIIGVLLSLVSTQGWASSGWQNPTDALDVSGDEALAPDDLLIVANELLQYVDPISKNGQLPPVSTAPPFLDVNGDCFIAPLDALLLVNSIHGDPDAWLNGVPSNTVLSPSDSAIELRLSDAAGNLISQSNVGSTVFLTAVLIDDAATSRGSFAGYLDLGFDDQLVSVVDTVFPVGRQLVNEGTLAAGLLTGIGSSTGNFGEIFRESFQGASELELFTVTFSVEELGVVDFTGMNGASLVFGNNDWLRPTLNGTSLTVVPEPRLGWLILLLLGVHQIVAFRHR